MIAIEEIPSYYQGYVKALGQGEIVPLLLKTGDECLELGKELTEAQGAYRYAEGKWSVKEVLQHIIDSERIFAYRALRFARNDQTEIPGFEQNDYVPESDADRRSIHIIMREFTNVRASTVDLYTSFTDEMKSRKGISNGVEMSVEALGYIISGHLKHHINIIYERYSK